MILIQQLVSIVLSLVASIFEVFKTVETMEELEERIQGIVQETTAKVFTSALEHIDKQLMRERDPKEWKNIGLRSRQVIASFGELTFKRRLYRNKRTGEYVFMLDQTLGWEEKRRLTPRLEKLVVELGVEMPFRRAAIIASYLTPGVSAMKVWEATKSAGDMAAAAGRLKQAEVFEHGVMPNGQRSIKELFIEADGVLVRQQRSAKRHGEVKLVVAYEGKAEAGGRRKLVNRQIIAGMEGSHSIWEEASAVLGDKWNLGDLEKVYIGGDGAGWPKQGVQLFPHSVYHLDEFHLKRKMTEALAHSKYFSDVQEGLRRLDFQATMAVLDRAIKSHQGPTQKKIKLFKQYLTDNWEGIAALPEEARLGAIEAEVRHTICRRMKRIGASWTPAGTNRMARLLAAKANGTLMQHIVWSGKTGEKRLSNLVGETPVERPPAGADPEEWLSARAPALYGPDQDQPWIRYVIRNLVNVGLVS